MTPPNPNNPEFLQVNPSQIYISKFQKSTGGRPAYDLDWKAFEALCCMQGTLEEISAVFSIDPDTLERSVKKQYGATFAEVMAEKKGLGRMSLRREQFVKALQSKDTTMQIWLGKQYLGQSDKQVNLNLNADLGTIPAEKQEALGTILDVLYADAE